MIGFTVAYFLVFHVRNLLWQIGAVPAVHGAVLDLQHHPHDLLDPVPRPNGIFNQALMGLGIIDEPLEFLLFSDFAVIVAYVHLFTLFMIVPIFNSMARIDPRDHRGGARRRRQRLAHHDRRIVIPLSKTGIALGSIFVITLVMGDFFVVKVMSGGQSGFVVIGDVERDRAAPVPAGGGQRGAC